MSVFEEEGNLVVVPEVVSDVRSDMVERNKGCKITQKKTKGWDKPSIGDVATWRRGAAGIQGSKNVIRGAA